MKALNFTNGRAKGERMKEIDLLDRHPCWYANLEDRSNRNKAKWVVGIKESGKVRECKFRVARFGDVFDEKLWERVTSIDFALEALEVFKVGEKEALLKWIKKQKE